MKNADIAKRRNTAIARGVGMMTQIYVERAENAEVWDVEGNRYIGEDGNAQAHKQPQGTGASPHNPIGKKAV